MVKEGPVASRRGDSGRLSRHAPAKEEKGCDRLHLIGALSAREALNKTGVVSWYETTGEL